MSFFPNYQTFEVYFYFQQAMYLSLGGEISRFDSPLDSMWTSYSSQPWSWCCTNYNEVAAGGHAKCANLWIIFWDLFESWCSERDWCVNRIFVSCAFRVFPLSTSVFVVVFKSDTFDKKYATMLTVSVADFNSSILFLRLYTSLASAPNWRSWVKWTPQLWPGDRMFDNVYQHPKYQIRYYNVSKLPVLNNQSRAARLGYYS